MWEAGEGEAGRELCSGQVIDQWLKADHVYGVIRLELRSEISGDAPGSVTGESFALNNTVPQYVAGMDQGLLRDREKPKTRHCSQDPCAASPCWNVDENAPSDKKAREQAQGGQELKEIVVGGNPQEDDTHGNGCNPSQQE